MKIGQAKRGQKHTKETKNKMSEAKLGSKHWSFGKKFSTERIDKISKDYIFINPDGESIKIHNLNKFCKENNLNASTMIGLIRGERTHHKNWTHKNSKIVQQKEYKLVDPMGNIHIFNNIRDFCKENKLTESLVSRLLSGHLKQHKGWKRTIG